MPQAYYLKWISSCGFEFEKNNNKQSLKIDPGTQKYIRAIHNVFLETSVLYMIYQCIFQFFIKFQNFQNYKITFSKNFKISKISKNSKFHKISKLSKIS